MAKERINRPKQQKQPLKSVLRKVFNKLTYFLLALSIVFAIYLIDRSKLLEPHISWEIDGELTTQACLLYTSPSPRDRQKSRMPSSA